MAPEQRLDAVRAVLAEAVRVALDEVDTKSAGEVWEGAATALLAFGVPVGEIETVREQDRLNRT